MISEKERKNKTDFKKTLNLWLNLHTEETNWKYIHMYKISKQNFHTIFSFQSIQTLQPFPVTIKIQKMCEMDFHMNWRTRKQQIYGYHIEDSTDFNAECYKRKRRIWLYDKLSFQLDEKSVKKKWE